MYVCLSMHMCKCECVHVWMHMCAHIGVCVSTYVCMPMCVCMSVCTCLHAGLCVYLIHQQLTHNIEDTGPATIKSIFTKQSSDGEGHDIAHLTASKTETSQFAALQRRCPLSPKCMECWRDAALWQQPAVIYDLYGNNGNNLCQEQ